MAATNNAPVSSPEDDFDALLLKISYDGVDDNCFDDIEFDLGRPIDHNTMDWFQLNNNAYDANAPPNRSRMEIAEETALDSIYSLPVTEVQESINPLPSSSGLSIISASPVLRHASMTSTAPPSSSSAALSSMSLSMEEEEGGEDEVTSILLSLVSLLPMDEDLMPLDRDGDHDYDDDSSTFSCPPPQVSEYHPNVLGFPGMYDHTYAIDDGEGEVSTASASGWGTQRIRRVPRVYELRHNIAPDDEDDGVPNRLTTFERAADYLFKRVSSSLAVTRVVAVPLSPTVPIDSSPTEWGTTPAFSVYQCMVASHNHGYLPLPVGMGHASPRTTMSSVVSRLVMESTRWEVDVCAICTEPYKEKDLVSYSRREDSCKHIFHPECIKDWLKIKNNCPCCRLLYV